MTRSLISFTGKALLIFCLLAGVTYGFSPADLEKVKTTNRCEDCDLSGADLANTVMNDVHLSNAKMAGANLTAADLSGANLSGATWTDGKQCEKGSMGACKTGAAEPEKTTKERRGSRRFLQPPGP